MEEVEEMKPAPPGFRHKYARLPSGEIVMHLVPIEGNRTSNIIESLGFGLGFAVGGLKIATVDVAKASVKAVGNTTFGTSVQAGYEDVQWRFKNTMYRREIARGKINPTQFAHPQDGETEQALRERVIEKLNPHPHYNPEAMVTHVSPEKVQVPVGAEYSL